MIFFLNKLCCGGFFLIECGKCSMSDKMVPRSLTGYFLPFLRRMNFRSFRFRLRRFLPPNRQLESEASDDRGARLKFEIKEEN